MPKVAVWQLDYDATHGVLLAGTHGRGAYTLQNRNASAALVVSKVDSGVPGRPGQHHRLHDHREEHRQRRRHRCQRSPTRSRRAPPSSRPTTAADSDRRASGGPT